MRKSIEKVMHLGINFWKDVGGFLEEKSRHVGTKIEQKSMPTSKSDFLKKPCFSLGKTMILRVQGVEVGGKNRSKIVQKSITERKGLPTSIFSGFWWILEAKLGRKIEPRQGKTGQDRVRKGKKRQDKE